MLYRFLRATLLLLLCLGFCLAHLWHKRAYYTSQHLSRLLQIPVTVQDVRVSRKTLNLYNIALSHPKGARYSHLLMTEKLTLSLENWRSSEYIFDHIQVENPLIALDEEAWALLLNRLQLSGSTEKKHYYFQIKRLQIKNLVYYLPLYPIQPKPIRSLEVIDIRPEKPLCSRLMIAACFRHLLAIAEQEKITAQLDKRLHSTTTNITIDSSIYDSEPRQSKLK